MTAARRWTGPLQHLGRDLDETAISRADAVATQAATAVFLAAIRAATREEAGGYLRRIFEQPL